ncbi:MAG: hypothetical protein WCV84_06115 [Patescibacteria group bacterium]|jgi:hypothetical protein
MDAEHILRVVEIYEKQLQDLSIEPGMHSEDQTVVSPRRAIQHAHLMLTSIRAHIQQGDLERAQRWLGFVQGVLWMSGIYTIAEMQTHNRST